MAPTPNPVKVVEVCRVTPTPPTSTSSCSAAPTGTIINDPDELERKYLTLVLQHSGSNNNNNNNNRRSLMILNVNASPGTMLGTFQLTRPSIENMQKRVNAQWQEKQSNIFHVSAFTITCAYVWVCLVKARKIIKTGKVHLGFIVDCRARLDPPILSTYFGNCVSTHLNKAPHTNQEDGVAVAAKAIGEVIGGLSDRFVKGVDDLSEFALLDMDRVFTIADSTDGNGGLEIGLMLNKQEIEAFPSLFATVKARKIGRIGKVHLGFIVDCRARLDPPFPGTYFGNCVSIHLVNADSKDLIAEDGVAVAAKAIGEVIGGLSDRLVKGVDHLSEFALLDMDRVFTIAGSPRFC
ncbi:hypothetical protein HYC85_017680 [Camellia sinensis]|uniref:Uncharacterized protein n=1 Tax=Camellia sinensis TaxID=4442 RepID=A0A7J7GS43_CAMSI|nr:hypothetical protein HYC85_017680 [Camellia sinensis]